MTGYKWTQAKIHEAALAQCAADCCCFPQDFSQSDNLVVPYTPSSGMRKDLPDPYVLEAVSWGPNVVFCTLPEVLPQLTVGIKGIRPAWRLFEPECTSQLTAIVNEEVSVQLVLAICFLPDLQVIAKCSKQSAYPTRILEPAQFASYYTDQWAHALCEKRKALDMLAVGAFDEDKLVGLAGCSADGENMWQIGIDVDPAYRKKGLATSLVSQLAHEILIRGKIPFYSAAWSNILSVKTAVACGFKPAWIQMWAISEDR